MSKKKNQSALYELNGKVMPMTELPQFGTSICLICDTTYDPRISACSCYPPGTIANNKYPHWVELHGDKGCPWETCTHKNGVWGK